MTSEQQEAPLCPTCGTKMRPAGPDAFVCEGCGSTKPNSSAELDPVDKLRERMDKHAPKLFGAAIMDMWLDILWAAYHDEEGVERLEVPDFETLYFDGEALEPLATMMRPVLGFEKMTLDDLLELIKEVIGEELHEYGVKLEWLGLREGLRLTMHLFVLLVESVEETVTP